MWVYLILLPSYSIKVGKTSVPLAGTQVLSDVPFRLDGVRSRMTVATHAVFTERTTRSAVMDT